MARHVFTLPLAVQGPMDDLMEEAMHAGIQLGRDRDWVPAHVDDAVYELLLAGSERLCYIDPRNPHYPFAVVVHMDQGTFIQIAQERHFWDPRGVEATLFEALGHADSPCELGFEIEGFPEPKSAHAFLARRAALETILT
jgi:hypothetical protein